MPSIHTLASDIQKVLGSGVNIEAEKEAALVQIGVDVAGNVLKSTSKREARNTTNKLYMSDLGTPCVRKLWYKKHLPEAGEEMQGHTLVKFLYGDILETTMLALATVAGHTVEKQQERITHHYKGWEISGRLDAVIDGVLVDVKTASTYSFAKFKEGLDDSNDSFGYRYQLSGYNGLIRPFYAEQGFVAIDKQNGHICYSPTPYLRLDQRLDKILPQLENPYQEPVKYYDSVPEGKSGNHKLCVECAYCPFKQHCWRDANIGQGLKAYKYSYGPVFLVHTVRTPNVPEITLKELAAA